MISPSRRSLFPLVLAGGAAGLGFLMFGRRAQAAEVERGIQTAIPSRGKKGGRAPLVVFTLISVPKVSRKTGKQITRKRVAEDLSALTEHASSVLGRKISEDVFALASMLASETRHDLGKAAVAWAALTYAGKKGRGLTEILTSGDGHLGSQHGRYASTEQPPSATDIEIAEGVRAKKIGNPAPGAMKWDSPRTQDALNKSGDPSHVSSAEVAANRKAEGLVAVSLPGIAMDDLRLWRPA